MSEKYEHIVIKKAGKVVESYIRVIKEVQDNGKEKAIPSDRESYKNDR
ncbi:hypothetical protein [Aneurinibacillus migulanus]|jgi:hypothetical protein|uniref:Uncharacterized protein n=1 Tax=Aneurinibacillus migulanus TaxID=47500 RepID=A0A1G8IPR0_ANEMI|nr:hypothetical protein [Aneurinibacillus migulanus]MCP1356907.1 hypothetical protein [Aneurinibacillus migulanus]MED0892391.1 hypothetical protein [Aneurinibacillus migulanus]MED1615656.1 hypothetical protein [Aneurinibacillus migulanus]SDI20500.1 hypothetical protein SAMN04487909_102108 [Aneurinibacillus migulanus]GED12499.1 hypothetical protein AMI01nite_04900 [Aneurinibacillus migulanus]